MTMKNPSITRNIVIKSKRTSIALESKFWSIFDKLKNDLQISDQELILRVEQRHRHESSLSSKIRLYCLEYMIQELEMADRKTQMSIERLSSLVDQLMR